MKRLINLSIVLLVFGFLTSTNFAQITKQAQEKNQFDKMEKLQNGFQGTNWIDADGDGICDNFGNNNSRSDKRNGMKNMRSGKGRLGDGSGLSPKDGTGFGRGNGSGIRPQGGTGFRRGSNGTGICNGLGPKGNSRRGGKN